jgi:hypothetical protein
MELEEFVQTFARQKQYGNCVYIYFGNGIGMFADEYKLMAGYESVRVFYHGDFIGEFPYALVKTIW